MPDDHLYEEILDFALQLADEVIGALHMLAESQASRMIREGLQARWTSASEVEIKKNPVDVRREHNGRVRTC